MLKRIHLICNAHLDPVWLWEWQEGAAEAISTFRTAADICENDNTIIFNHNEVTLYEWVREYEPSLFERIKKLVKKGRWHIMGGWYLQPDCNMPSGESFVRQILAGRQYFKKHFNAKPTTAINFDPFGHSRGLVQIMAKSGYDSYLFGRPHFSFMELKDEPFIWVGFDGSQVMAKRFSGWYNTQLGKAKKQVAERIDTSNEAVQAVLWGVGNHGGGPSRKDLADLNDLIKERKDVEIIHSTPEKYFKEAKKKFDSLTVRKADLNPWAIGCYTSAIRIKQKHRELENELYMTEKMASCAVANKSMCYPQEEFLRAQKDLLFTQFHDILPGSSIQPVEDAAIRMADHGLEILSRVKARCFFALASGQKKAKESTIPVFVYNPHPYPVRKNIECEFNLPDFNFEDSFFDIKMSQNGKNVNVQVEKELSNMFCDWRKRVVFDATLLPGQMNRFDCNMHKLPAKPTVKQAFKNGKFVFKNETMTVHINTKTGLIDKYIVDGINYINNNGFCPVVIEDNEDPWEVAKSKFGKQVGKFKLLSKEAGTKFSGLTDKNIVINSVRVIEDGQVRTVVEAVLGFEESFVCQKYKLPKIGAEIEVETRVFWSQKNRMLKLSIPLTYQSKKFLGQTAFGTQELPINGNEAVAQKWVAAVNNKDNMCLSCINDGIYGFDLTDNRLRLSLLRSPAYSAHPTGDKVILCLDRFANRIDQGERLFKFWINAGKVTERLKNISVEAAIQNEKPFALSFFPQGQGVTPKPLISIDNKAIEMSAFKRAENNDGWIVRLFNSIDKPQSVQLKITALGINKKIKLTGFEAITLKIKGKKIFVVNFVEETV